jgi:hypothetical protein
MPPGIALVIHGLEYETCLKSPATKDDRKQPNAIAKLLLIVFEQPTSRPKGELFQRCAMPWRKSRLTSWRCGGLRTNVSRINYHVDSIRPERLMLNIASGSLSQEQVLQSMRLCAEAVMPALRGL